MLGSVFSEMPEAAAHGAGTNAITSSEQLGTRKKSSRGRIYLFIYFVSVGKNVCVETVLGYESSRPPDVRAR